MAKDLKGMQVAILATDGVEQVELTRPRQAIEAAGATVELVAPEADAIQGFDKLDKADTFAVDKSLSAAAANDYDGLVLPGGVANPDTLRMNDDAVAFVRRFFEQSKPVAAICHAPWLLVEADVVDGRTLTSYPSVKTDIRNAGGRWIDAEVHADNGLVTSRRPDDLEAFCSKAIEELDEGRHTRQSA